MENEKPSLRIGSKLIALVAVALLVIGLGAAVRPGSASAQSSEVTICFHGVTLTLPRVAVLDSDGNLVDAYASATLGPCEDEEEEIDDEIDEDDLDSEDMDDATEDEDEEDEDQDRGGHKDNGRKDDGHDDGGSVKVDIDGGPQVQVQTNNGPQVRVEIDDEPEVKVKTEEQKIEVETGNETEVEVKNHDGTKIEVETDEGPEVDVRANNAPNIEVNIAGGPDVEVQSTEDWDRSNESWRDGYKDHCDRYKVSIWEWDWKKCGNFCDFPDWQTAEQFRHLCEKDCENGPALAYEDGRCRKDVKHDFDFCKDGKKDFHDGKAAVYKDEEHFSGGWDKKDHRCEKEVRHDFDPCKGKSDEKKGVVFKDEKYDDWSRHDGFKDKDHDCRTDVKHFDPCKDFHDGKNDFHKDGYEVRFDGKKDFDEKHFDARDKKDYGRDKAFDKDRKDCPKQVHDPCKDFDKHGHEVRFDGKKDFGKKDFYTKDKKDFYDGHKGKDDRHKDVRFDDKDCKVIVIIKKPVVIKEKTIIVEHKTPPPVVIKDEPKKEVIAPPRPPASRVTVGAITPPSTGDAGLTDETRSGGLSALPVILLTLAAIAGVRRLQTR